MHRSFQSHSLNRQDLKCNLKEKLLENRMLHKLYTGSMAYFSLKREGKKKPTRNTMAEPFFFLSEHFTNTSWKPVLVFLFKLISIMKNAADTNKTSLVHHYNIHMQIRSSLRELRCLCLSTTTSCSYEKSARTVIRFHVMREDDVYIGK